MTAPTFLPDDKIANAIKELIRESKTLKIAVAYWGKRAIDGLDLEELNKNKELNKKKDVQILCDLKSGGSNPDEIKELQKIVGEDKIKHLDNLHAKIWIGDHAVIVGSSNASANGQGWEGRETKGLIEVNSRIDDAKFLKKSTEWFDEQWRKGKYIDEDMIKEAKENWKKRIINKQTTSFHDYEIDDNDLIFIDYAESTPKFSIKENHEENIKQQIGLFSKKIRKQIIDASELQFIKDKNIIENKWVLYFFKEEENISYIYLYRTSHVIKNCFSYNEKPKKNCHAIIEETKQKTPPKQTQKNKKKKKQKNQTKTK